MNAYELADDLDGWNDDWLSDKNEKNVFKEHANMLRQQADRIAELNEEANNLARTIDGLTSEILGKRQTKQCKDCGEINPAEIHTCSPQTKPLSDEEIIQIFTKVWDAGGNANGVFIRFGRAIEAKVRGEK